MVAGLVSTRLRGEKNRNTIIIVVSGTQLSQMVCRFGECDRTVARPGARTVLWAARRPPRRRGTVRRRSQRVRGQTAYDCSAVARARHWEAGSAAIGDTVALQLQGYLGRVRGQR